MNNSEVLEKKHALDSFNFINMPCTCYNNWIFLFGFYWRFCA